MYHESAGRAHADDMSEVRMYLNILKPGHRIRLRNGATARVLSEAGDGDSVEVEYLETEDNTPPAGTRSMVVEEEVEVLLGVAHPRAWEGEVSVVLHHASESEDSEAYFEAVTMKGVPYGVSVSGGDPESAEDALTQLCNGLRAFGFRGRVLVQDVTKLGQAERYEVSL